MWKIALMALLVAGCTADAQHDQDISVGCISGETRACLCIGGGSGVQICQPDNSFGPCQCSEPDVTEIDASDASLDTGSPDTQPPPPTCDDGLWNQDETGPDCGGESCGARCDDGAGCTLDADCGSGFCNTVLEMCATPSCSDSTQNQDETDEDCGGETCRGCAADAGCETPSDCLSGVCLDAILPARCAQATCTDDVLNGDESSVDCGGFDCEGCGTGERCLESTDCASFVCVDEACLEAACDDAVHNGDEADVDCGGSCPATCANGSPCTADEECTSGFCHPSGSCAAPGCGDSVLNSDETDVDCGGSCGATCEVGEICATNADCADNSCNPILTPNPLCETPNCFNVRLDGEETDRDCGGSVCEPCNTGKRCLLPRDCTSGVCSGTPGDCLAPTCNDKVQNQDETDVDCGGLTCDPCANGQSCENGIHCASGYCDSSLTCAACSSLDLRAFEPGFLANDVPHDGTVDATFSCAVDLSSASPAVFAVRGHQSPESLGPFTTSDLRTLSLDPTSDFKAGERIHTALYSGISSTEGVLFSRSFEWEFRAAVGGTGRGDFGTASTGLVDSTVEATVVAFADFDADGDLDIFYATGNQISTLSGGVLVYQNQGGVFSAVGTRFDTQNRFNDGDVGDLDGDGDLDVLMYAGDDNEAVVYTNDGTSPPSFTRASVFALGNLVTRGPTLGDLDGDGDLDAFISMTVGNQIWLGNGSGGFARDPANQSLGSVDTSATLLGDFDNDGDLDALCVNLTEPNRLWENDGSGSFKDAGALGVGSSSSVRGDTGDIDHDGDLDIVVANRAGGSQIWLNDGGFSFTAGTQLSTAHDVAFGDLDSDGDLDLLLARQDGPNAIWKNNGIATGVFVRDTNQDLGSETSARAELIDIDGDLDLDAYIGIHSSSTPDALWFNGP